MTRNDVKERLTRAKDAERDILLLDGEHHWAMDNIADLKRIQSHNDLAPAIASLKRYDRGIVAQRDALLHMRGSVLAQIERVPDVRGREILHRRYVERETWEQIGEALCYDVRYCSRLHNRALDALTPFLQGSSPVEFLGCTPMSFCS